MDSYRPSSRDGVEDEGNSTRRNDQARDFSRADDRRRNDDSDRRINNEASREYTRSRDYYRPNDRPRDYYDRRPRGTYDSRYQDYAPGSGYQDPDRGGYGRRRWESSEQIDYDEQEEDDRRDRGRFDARRVAPLGNINYSDALRWGKQHAPPARKAEQDVDAESKPSPYLLVRGLKSTVDEQLLAKGLEKLYREAGENDAGATPLSLRSVMLVRTRADDNFMGWGFAEYDTAEDAVAARKCSLSLGDQCTVASQKFTLDFPHNGVFIWASMEGTHAPGMTTHKDHTFYSPHAQRDMKYRDERYYTRSELVNKISPTEKLDLSKTSTKTTSASTQSGSKRGLDAPESRPSKPKKAKKIPEQSGPLAELQNWQSKQAELREDLEPASEAPKSTEQTYAVDTAERKACFLCGRNFEKSEVLMKHLRESVTHLACLEDDARKAKGLQRLEKNRIDPAETVKLPALPAAAPVAAEGQQWRDRAAERRQEDAAAPQKVKIALKGASQKSGRPSSSGNGGAGLAKGQQMMAKLGWSEGQGLGAEGAEGRTAPVEQRMFAAGVGLGHEGSARGDAVEEAAKRTRDDRGGFLEATKEAARKRFEGM